MMAGFAFGGSMYLEPVMNLAVDPEYELMTVKMFHEQMALRDARYLAAISKSAEERMTRVPKASA